MMPQPRFNAAGSGGGGMAGGPELLDIQPRRCVAGQKCDVAVTGRGFTGATMVVLGLGERVLTPRLHTSEHMVCTFPPTLVPGDYKVCLHGGISGRRGELARATSSFIDFHVEPADCGWTRDPFGGLVSSSGASGGGSIVRIAAGTAFGYGGGAPRVLELEPGGGNGLEPKPTRVERPAGTSDTVARPAGTSDTVARGDTWITLRAATIGNSSAEYYLALPQGGEAEAGRILHVSVLGPLADREITLTGPARLAGPGTGDDGMMMWFGPGEHWLTLVYDGAAAWHVTQFGRFATSLRD